MDSLFLQELKARKQTALIESFNTVCESYDVESMPFMEGVNLMAEVAQEIRLQNKYEKDIKAANLPCSRAHRRDADYIHSRRLEREVFNYQFQLHWLKDKAHVVITGPSQIGKNWLASALCVAAIEAGNKVKAYNVEQLLNELGSSRSTIGKGGKSSFDLKIDELSKLDLIFLHGFCNDDEPNLSQLKDLNLLIRAWHKEKSLIVTSPVPSTLWKDYFEHSYLGDSIVNRILGRATVFDLDGEPYQEYPTGKRKNGKLSS